MLWWSRFTNTTTRSWLVFYPSASWNGSFLFNKGNLPRLTSVFIEERQYNEKHHPKRHHNIDYTLIITSFLTNYCLFLCSGKDFSWTFRHIEFESCHYKSQVISKHQSGTYTLGLRVMCCVACCVGVCVRTWWSNHGTFCGSPPF